jgi:hypothetical protein
LERLRHDALEHGRDDLIGAGVCCIVGAATAIKAVEAAGAHFDVATNRRNKCALRTRKCTFLGIFIQFNELRKVSRLPKKCASAERPIAVQLSTGRVLASA